MPEWQPIETAPVNTKVLIAWKRYPTDIRISMLSPSGNWTAFYDGHSLERPDYWMPLPSHPLISSGD